MKACNIIWDIDMKQILEKLDDMTADNAVKALQIPYQTFINMSTSEIHDYAYDMFEHNQAAAAEFMGLPEEVEIPNSVGTDEDDISDWLSDEYEFCHKGFTLDTDK